MPHYSPRRPPPSPQNTEDTATAAPPEELALYSIVREPADDWYGDMPAEHRVTLQVMDQDGNKRPATSLFEWFQQFFIEQCALVAALQDAGIYCEEEGYSQLANADGFEVPTLRTCGTWATHLDHRPEYLVQERRQVERELRVARVVLDHKAIPQDVIDMYVKPLLVPDIATSFPCKPSGLSSFFNSLYYGDEDENMSAHVFKSGGSEEQRRVFVEIETMEGGDYFAGYAISSRAAGIHQFLWERIQKASPWGYRSDSADSDEWV